MLRVPNSQRERLTFKSTASLEDLHIPQGSPGRSSSNLQHEQYTSFEYEDITSFSDDDSPTLSNVTAVNSSDVNISSPATRKVTDILARESDVIISTQITPLTEYKGFAVYTLAGLFYTVWLLWTFLPKKWLNYIGVYYYPSRWWSISFSSFVLVLMLNVYIGLQLWDIEFETLKIDDLRNVIDDDAVVEKDWRSFGWNVTNGVHDLRITDANRILYDDLR